MESLELLPNNLKQWLLETVHSLGVSTEWLPIVSCVLTISPILLVFPGLFALTTVFERKGLGRIQNRYGPNRVGPCGFFQFAADGIKSLTKEDVVPDAADKLLHFLAPVVLAVPAVLMFSVIPFGKHLVPIEIEAGLLFFFAVGGVAELAIFMAGWGSRNKYSLLGAMRAIAQMISYEVPLILAAVVVVMISGTLNPVEIAGQQVGDSVVAVFSWNIFSPWGALAGVLFFIAMLAEANRSPFDLPEGESELVAGYFTEYSGFKFALFFMAEYLGLFAAMGMGITLFLGGWGAPLNAAQLPLQSLVVGTLSGMVLVGIGGFYWLRRQERFAVTLFAGLGAMLAFQPWIPTWVWFLAKLLLGIFFVIWIRGTMPRIRMDQLMNFAWKFMLPLALLNILLVGVINPGDAPFAIGLVQWLFTISVILGAWYFLGQQVAGGEAPKARRYRYAE